MTNQKRRKHATRRQIAAVLTVASAAAPLAACGSSGPAAVASGTHVVTDITGAAVKVPDSIERIADGWPANIEVLQMLGAGPKIVALPAYISSSYPTKKWIYKIDPSLLKAEQTFSGSNFNAETLLSLHPDVLLLSNQSSSPALAAQTTKEGIPTVEMGFENFAALKTMVNTTADALGTAFARQQAAKYDAYLDKTLGMVTAVTSKIPAPRRPTVMHFDELSPPTVDGAPSMIDAWITAAGGRDVAQFGGSPGNGHRHTVTSEQILKWNPDVIIVGSDAGGNTDTAPQSVDAVKAIPGLENLPAVKDGRVYANPDGAFLWDFYGIEEALQIQWAAKLLYPKQFASLDMVKVVENFYSEFFNYKLTDADANAILTAQPPPG